MRSNEKKQTVTGAAGCLWLCQYCSRCQFRCPVMGASQETGLLFYLSGTMASPRTSRRDIQTILSQRCNNLKEGQKARILKRTFYQLFAYEAPGTCTASADLCLLLAPRDPVGLRPFHISAG